MSLRVNPLPWQNWSEWHETGWDDWRCSGFPIDGSPHWIRAYDYGNQKLLATTRQLLKKRLDKNYALKFIAAVESVAEDDFLRCTMVVRLDRLNPDGSIPSSAVNATALYSEYDFFTGRNTRTIATPGGRFKFEVVGQAPVGGGYREYRYFDLTQNLIEHWNGHIVTNDPNFTEPIDINDYYIRYIAPTIEARNGGALIWIMDMVLYADAVGYILNLGSAPDGVPFTINGITYPANSVLNVFGGEELIISVPEKVVDA